ncbi:MAG: polyprenyl synthetase family protein [Bacteroides sp.]|nr:polyprenyl synthetase family protein [Bacteroides sp.]
MHSRDYYLDLIHDAINALRFPREPQGLYDPITYALDCGGKRLRPMLTLAAAEACGLDPQLAVNQALAVEIFHNFTLLHDDVMDRADVRRGRPTVHMKWDDNTAILSGDAMLTYATIILAENAAECLPQLLAMFNKTAMEVYEGQQYDMDFESRQDVTVNEYINMISLKTSVLLGCACALGAIRAQAHPQNVEALYKFGHMLGLAFQLRDDWLDTFGDTAMFGKAIGGDILNGKKTWLLINALERDESGEVKKWLAVNDMPPERIAAVTAAYRRLGLDTECQTEIDSYIDRAIAALSAASLPHDAKEFFTNLAEATRSRNN